MPYRLSADIGGTFTDIVKLDVVTALCETTKVPTTLKNLSVGIVEGFDEITGGDYSDVIDIVHGTTNGLNAVIERAGARTAVITTRGFRDAYEIGRGNHPEMYNVRYRKPTPLVARSDIFELDERIRADGSIEQAVDGEQLDGIIERIAGSGYESVAVCLINSFANRVHELQVRDRARARLDSAIPITASADVSPESREFERFSTAILNAYVSPAMNRYLVDLDLALRERGFTGELAVMNSNGGRMSLEAARREPVRTLMSGPIGGVIGTAFVGASAGIGDLIAIDMGGTSFDVSMLDDGRLDIVMETTVEGIPVLVPTVNTLSVGAGGGSIAWSEVGAMRVGPQSAGAVPGPIAYGHGGLVPTVTDANLVLGRIDVAGFLDGRMGLDVERPAQAFRDYGTAHGLAPLVAAEGVLQIAGNTMADAIREITLWRGRDVRDMTLLAYGGAGPMHAALIADQLDVRRILVPSQPGAFSAWGMLHADIVYDRSRALLVRLDALKPADFDAIVAALQAELRDALPSGQDAPSFITSLDVRYVGQEYTLNIDVAGGLDAATTRAEFDATYERLYGFSTPSAPVEVLGIRVSGSVTERHKPRLAAQDPTGRGSHTANAHFDGADVDIRVHHRDNLILDELVAGPALIIELTATTVVPPGWSARTDTTGSLVLERVARSTNTIDEEAA